MSEVLTTQQVAERLNVTRQHIVKLMDSGALQSVDVSLPGAKRRTRRVRAEDLERFLTARANDRRRR